jgi:hypothetical protein
MHAADFFFSVIGGFLFVIHLLLFLYAAQFTLDALNARWRDWQ